MPSVPFANVVQPAKDLFKRLTTITPTEAKTVVGLDIGSTSIKVIALGSRKGAGPRPIIAQNLVPLDAGQEADASGAIKSAMTTLQLPVRVVNISVSGQWVIMRIVEMPTMKPAEMRQALPFEAQRYLPFNVQDVVLDGTVLGPAENNKMWVLIVACKRELLERRISWVQQAGYTVVCIDVDALALANAFVEQAGERPKGGIHALIDVGAQRTSLVVLKNGIPYLVRDIPWGAVKLVRHMAEQLGVDEAALGQQLTHDVPLPAELVEAMKRISESLTVDLQLSFDFFENRFGPSPEQLLISGGLSQCAGFVDALKSHFAQPIAAWSPAAGLSGAYAVAYGLALRAVPN